MLYVNNLHSRHINLYSMYLINFLNTAMIWPMRAYRLSKKSVKIYQKVDDAWLELISRDGTSSLSNWNYLIYASLEYKSLKIVSQRVLGWNSSWLKSWFFGGQLVHKDNFFCFVLLYAVSIEEWVTGSSVWSFSLFCE